MIVGALVGLLAASALAVAVLGGLGKETSDLVPFVTASIGVLAGLPAPTPLRRTGG